MRSPEDIANDLVNAPGAMAPDGRMARGIAAAIAEEREQVRWLPSDMTPTALHYVAACLESPDNEVEITQLRSWADELEARQKGGE